MHQVNLPDSHLPVPKKAKEVKLSREVKIVHQLTPDPELMKDWAEDSATLYLAGTIYYWLEKVITKTSNIKCMWQLNSGYISQPSGSASMAEFMKGAWQHRSGRLAQQEGTRHQQRPPKRR